MSKRNISWTIGANVENFNKNIKKVEKKFHEIGRQTTYFGRDLRSAVTVPVLAAGGAILALAHKTGEYASSLTDLSNTTGVTTTALQELTWAMGQNGIGQDMLQRLLERNNQRMARAAAGNATFADSYKKLGVEIYQTNGELRGAEEVFDDVLRGLAAIENGSVRAAIAGDLLGVNAGRKLAGALNNGIGSIDELRRSAHELGIVMDEEAIATAKVFQAEMDRFQQRVAATGRTVALEFMPVIIELIPLAEDLAVKIGENVRRFADLDPELQKQRIQWAGIAAAIGPALILMGSVITSTGKIIGMMRVLGALMLSNPFTAIATGMAAVAAQALLVERRMRNARDLIQDALHIETTGSVEEIEKLNNAIAIQEERLKKREIEFQSSNEAARRVLQRSLDEERQTLQALINMRDQAAYLQLDEIISQKEVDNAKDLADHMERAVVARYRMPAQKPIDDIWDPTEEATRILSDRFEADRRRDLEFLLFGPDEDYSHRLEHIKEETREVEEATMEWGYTAGQVFDRLVWQGERLSSVLQSIGRQLVTRGVVSLLTGGAGGFLSGLPKFHTGGVVPGPPSMERLALVRGQEEVFTPQQAQTLRAGVGGGAMTVHIVGELVGRGDTLRGVIDERIRKFNRAHGVS